MSDIDELMFGPGSQKSEVDESDFSFMEMPKSMSTFTMPTIPEPEDIEGNELVIAKLEEIYKTLQRAVNEHKNAADEDKNYIISLNELSQKNVSLINQFLGEGEIAIIVSNKTQIQESVFAGVWRVHIVDEQGKVIDDYVEIGSYPKILLQESYKHGIDKFELSDDLIPEGVYNAAPVLFEISEKLKASNGEFKPHAINLTLLPQTEQDLDFLFKILGDGNVVILSRGYGNCRVSNTAINNVWWVQYYNSQDTLILNQLEVSIIPDVSCASIEDLEDSLDRINEILEIYR